MEKAKFCAVQKMGPEHSCCFNVIDVLMLTTLEQVVSVVSDNQLVETVYHTWYDACMVFLMMNITFSHSLIL